MMAGRGVDLTAAGGPARHIPVMLSEVIEALEPRDGKHLHRWNLRRRRL